MSVLARLAPNFTKSLFFHHPRYVATTSVGSDPIQKLFLDKIKEFKASNKGLDEAHQKLMTEEMARLKRIFNVEDENRLSSMEFKFPKEHDISLHDLDENKEMRQRISSGEYQKQITEQRKPRSEILATIPEQIPPDEFSLPRMNKPDASIILESISPPGATQVSGLRPDYESNLQMMTTEKLSQEFLVRFGPNMPTIDDDKSPQRDTVNFPRIPIADDTPPSRYHIFPESWFQFFYPKTGVTGPYIFTGTVLTFVLSKEWLVLEHELMNGLPFYIVVAFLISKYGHRISSWLKKETKMVVDGWDDWQQGNIKTLEKMQDHYKSQMNRSGILDELYKIREQDIDTQLESEYRERLRKVHNDVKSRLNYLVAVNDSTRQVMHKNMVTWIISNAVSSIGAKQETEVLDNCIRNLKLMSNNNANVI